MEGAIVKQEVDGPPPQSAESPPQPVFEMDGEQHCPAVENDPLPSPPKVKPTKRTKKQKGAGVDTLLSPDPTAKPATQIKKHKPPRARSAYAHFFVDFRKTMDPGTATTLGAISTQCSVAWKALEDKSQYMDMASTSRALCHANDPPKRPPSAYIRYCSAERPSIKATDPDISFADMSKRLGAGWRALTDEARLEWQTRG